MTYCEEVGLKVGDEIEYIGDRVDIHPHPTFSVGDILILIGDDRSTMPEFESKRTGEGGFFDLEGRSWIKIKKEESTMIKRDDKVNVEMTAEELLFLRALLGSSNAGGISFKTFCMLAHACDNLFSDFIYLEDTTDITGQVKDFNSKVDEFFTTEPSPQELKIKELEETINKAQKELQEYKALTQDK